MAKTYSHDLKVGDRLDKLSDSAMKATDEGFYGTASVKELVGWKISKVFRETKDVAEDKIYGGFCYMIATKDDQMIMAFRGTAGEMEASLLTRKGDWYNDFLTYPFGTDPGVEWAELAMTGTANNSTAKKLYITGHSRAGMLAQRAGAKLAELGKDELLQRLTYFNGLGIVMNLTSSEHYPTTVPDIKEVTAFENIQKIKNKIFAYRIYNWLAVRDLVSILGVHVVVPIEYYESWVLSLHSMSNFTYHMYMGERGEIPW